jgi:hypothetical protein
MKKISFSILIIVSILAFIITPAFATKPGETVNPNGFPSGPHFNLLIHGKPETFTCPELTYYFEVNVPDGESCLYKEKPVVDGELVGSCEFLSCINSEGQSVTIDATICTETDVPNYGNVINMPRFETNDPITIVMESGKKGPKSQPAALTLMVTDWCTESFPNDGTYPPPLGDEARILLPNDPDGYAVYARVLGKPKKIGDGPSFVMLPELDLIQNEYFVDLDGDGVDDLLLLGFISPDGIFNPDGVEIDLKRSEGKGKGAKSATDISPLFKWEGNICYVEGDPLEEETFCEGACSTLNLCCIDNDSDGVYDECKEPIDGDNDGYLDACDSGYYSVEGECKWIQNDWVFNIADFVNVLWNVTENKDVYNVQIRFYPLPLNGEAS